MRRAIFYKSAARLMIRLQIVSPRIACKHRLPEADGKRLPWTDQTNSALANGVRCGSIMVSGGLAASRYAPGYRAGRASMR